MTPTSSRQTPEGDRAERRAEPTEVGAGNDAGPTKGQDLVNHQSLRPSVRGRRLVSIEDAAEYGDVSTKTIRRRIADGTITSYRLGPRLLRVDLNEVDEKLLRPVVPGDHPSRRGKAPPRPGRRPHNNIDQAAAGQPDRRTPHRQLASGSPDVEESTS